MSDTPTVEEIVEQLRPLARPNALEGMARFGIATESALGVSMPDLRAMGKSLGRNHGARSNSGKPRCARRVSWRRSSPIHSR
jgi:3-methyladenine DNA glycosylase AlkD